MSRVTHVPSPVTWVGHIDEPWSAAPRQPILELLGPALAENDSALVVFDDGASYTGAELHDRIERFAGALGRRVKAGDRVLLACGNRLEYLVAYFAIIANRCTVVAVPPTVREQDAAYALKDAACVLAVAEADAADTIEALRGDLPDLAEVIRVEGPEPEGLAAAIAEGDRLRLADVQAELTDLIDIGFTSGTTGLPKALGGDHTELLRYVDVLLRTEPNAPDERVMLGLQFHYGDPLSSTVAAALSRTSVLVMRRFSVSGFWTAARDYGATRIVTIGSIPNLLLTATPSPAERDHGVRFATAVGIPKDRHAELEERFAFPWVEVYGSSEAGPAIMMPPHAAPAYVGTGALGVPLPDIEARLVDPTTGEVVEGEGSGELEMSGEIIFTGYLNAPEATAESLHDGWLRSGDLMRRDADGIYYFEGRRKELIRRGGENVAPAEVEGALRLHPDVIDAAVVAVADDLQGEEIKAYVQVHEGADVAPEALAEFCADRLARFKVPRYIALRTEPFPRTPSQRIKKELLKVDGRHTPDEAWDRQAHR